MSHSCGNAKKFDPYRIETPNPIGIKIGTVDYVCETVLCAEFYANPSMGGFSANGRSIRAQFLFIYTFFQQLTCRSDPSADFRARWLRCLL